MRRIALAALVAVVAVSTLLVSPAPARADHVEVYSYTGTAPVIAYEPVIVREPVVHTYRYRYDRPVYTNYYTGARYRTYVSDPVTVYHSHSCRSSCCVPSDYDYVYEIHSTYYR